VHHPFLHLPFVIVTVFEVDCPSGLRLIFLPRSFEGELALRVEDAAMTLLQSVFKHPFEFTPVRILYGSQAMLHIVLEATPIDVIFVSGV
jgi:hypothetical protein